MGTKIIHQARIQRFHDDQEREGDYVLYGMRAAQRAQQNHALEWAIQKSNDLRLPLLVAFPLWFEYPESHRRHFQFMLEGLEKTAVELERRKIKFILKVGQPKDVYSALAERAALVVLDEGFLRFDRELVNHMRETFAGPTHLVDSESVVPHRIVTDKQEYAARTIRPKIMRQLDEHKHLLNTTALGTSGLSLEVVGTSFEEAYSKCQSLERKAPFKTSLIGGTEQAKSRFRNFLENELSDYDKMRNQPQTPKVSNMGAYLHYGQVSSLHLCLLLDDFMGRGSQNSESFVEELVVRRQLSQNFCLYAKDYDSFTCLPEWAKESLEKHKSDRREHSYSREQLERAETHDPYWNAAQKQMVHTGYMHNHMRMYWGKQILAWSNTPQEAFYTCLYLNNRYQLDGRDACSYANIAWLFGIHDQGWKEREVFGKVRCMTEGGLKRKCQPDAYVEWVNRRVEGLE